MGHVAAEHLGGQPGLAGASGSDECDQPGLPDQPGKLGQLTGPANEAGLRHRQRVAPANAGAARRELRLEPGQRGHGLRRRLSPARLPPVHRGEGHAKPAGQLLLA